MAEGVVVGEKLNAGRRRGLEARLQYPEKGLADHKVEVEDGVQTCCLKTHPT